MLKVQTNFTFTIKRNMSTSTGDFITSVHFIGDALQVTYSENDIIIALLVAINDNLIKLNKTNEAILDDISGPSRVTGKINYNPKSAALRTWKRPCRVC